MTDTARPPGAAAALRPARPGVDVLLVLGVSLGQSAVYSVLSLADSLTRGPLNRQVQTLNPQQNDRAVFDLVEQLLAIAFPLVPVLLAFYLMGPGVLRRTGLDLRRPGFDVGGGVLLAACIGVPGLALYFGAVALGLNLNVDTSGIGPQWYAVPVLVLSAARAAVQEEVIVVAFLVDRLDAKGWRPWAVLLTSALLRGSYHLYQGFGGFVGNAVMGVVFVLVYRRWGRLGPLLVAHFVLDLVSFIGYDVLRQLAPGLLP
ncbi:CPBP family intramembrane glutamic endopeptidase [Amnibacterium setariae]|uniref:CPBP family intramembrane metalloprotease n=1 Tax=Amnibacterium setariae TaxID=2306585 RepID=A0A3A1U3F6_9MICO|nr:CPBP family intramembrane glutamic endopeptidase [Amnibacterium setariae]RIX30922.1 CPBP family intramembrane metalloprotease [Amnibacterium setariae]